MTLRLLIVEDSDDDERLVIRELRRSGFDVVAHRVETAEHMAKALATETFDLVISDYRLPTFDALGALDVLKKSGRDLPFIIVSGSIGEESAVEALRAGASDFVVKDRLARLAPAVRRELADARVRQERANSLAALQDALRARDEFLSIASHELRTPVAALVLQCESIKRSVARGKPVEVDTLITKLTAIERAARRLDALAARLLDVSRLSGGERVPLVRERIDLVSLVREVAARMAEQHALDPSLVTVIAAGPVEGSWDADKLDIAIGNLVDNAFKYGGGQPITIDVSADESGAVVRVRDRGPGVERAARTHIFDRYARAAPHTQYSGFGIGLWAARLLVEAHGGTLTIADDDGPGAEFILRLPASA